MLLLTWFLGVRIAIWHWQLQWKYFWFLERLYSVAQSPSYLFRLWIQIRYLDLDRYSGPRMGGKDEERPRDRRQHPCYQAVKAVAEAALLRLFFFILWEKCTHIHYKTQVFLYLWLKAYLTFTDRNTKPMHVWCYALMPTIMLKKKKKVFLPLRLTCLPWFLNSRYLTNDNTLLTLLM